MIDLKEFYRRYTTQQEEVVVRNRRFRLLLPKAIEPFLDPEEPMRDFPLWAKIWEASLVLADVLAVMPPDPARNILEIGCGAGFVGIVAAAFGHGVTMTEYNRDALAFAEANAALNLPELTSKLNIRHLDWHHPDLEGPFDLITASEVIYNERDFEPLERLFKTLLKDGGEILLAEGLRRTTMEFFKRMSAGYQVQVRKLKLHSRQKEVPVLLARARRRPVQVGQGLPTSEREPGSAPPNSMAPPTSAA